MQSKSLRFVPYREDKENRGPKHTASNDDANAEAAELIPYIEEELEEEGLN